MKVNDLHTADLSSRLAEQLNASYVINGSLDRNELDLNRISQVSRRAPWFFDLLARLLAEILSREKTAQVLFVHGWNVTQARCDIGIGSSITTEAGTFEENGTTTVSGQFFRERLRPFRELCETAGIRTTYGERYPASHPNNVLQIFRRPPAPRRAGALGRISQWVADDRIEAVQLELGVAVRWPGTTRRAFVGATTHAFAATKPRILHAVLARPQTVPSHPPPAGLQCFDPYSRVGLTAGVSVEGTGVRGRLLLFLGGQRVALFVGEDRDLERLTSGGPEFEALDRGFRLRFDGPILSVENGGLYLNLEEAFAASALQTANIDLRFEGDGTSRYGRVQGVINLNGQSWRIDCHGFGGAPVRTPNLARRSHTVLAAGFGAGLALQIRTDHPRRPCGSVIHSSADTEQIDDLHALSVALDADGYTPKRITVALPGDNAVVAEPLNHMSIYRPGAGKRPVRVTFGIARVQMADRRGFGFYEHSRPQRLAAGRPVSGAKGRGPEPGPHQPPTPEP